MKTLLNNTDFSDCTTRDFSHYFSSTVMVWDMTPTKRRAFVVGDVDADPQGRPIVRGHYLTKLREWKARNVLFSDWVQTLHPVAIRDMWFKVDTGAAAYAPNMRHNLKKSIKWDYSGFTLLGNPSAEQQSTQGMTYWTFRDLYERVEADRPLWAVLRTPTANAEVTDHGFIVERNTDAGFDTVYHRGRHFANYLRGKNLLSPVSEGHSMWWKYLATQERLPENGINIGSEK